METEPLSMAEETKPGNKYGGVSRKPKKKARAPRTVKPGDYRVEKRVNVRLTDDEMADEIDTWEQQITSDVHDVKSALKWIGVNGWKDATYRVIRVCAERTVRQKQMNVLE